MRKKITLDGVTEKDVLKVLDKIGTIAYEEQEELSVTECMEVLELMFKHLFKDDAFCFHGVQTVNTAWFKNKRKASKRLGVDLNSIEDGYYFLTKDGLQAVDYLFVIFVAGSMVEKIQKRVS